MPTPKDILGQLSGGRVLDVATGSGNFIHFLLDGLKDYSEIIGIDANERAAAVFGESFKANPRIQFQWGDALQLNFAADSFDLVCISNSLHHFKDPEVVLGQMQRVLRPGGHLLVAEMFCDGQSETQLTHVYLHHWWAAVDTASGVLHRETYRRQELVDLLVELGLQELALFDLSDPSEDPFDPAILAELDPVFERYIQRAQAHPDLQQRGRELRQRVQNTGFHSAAALVAIGRKPETV